MPPAGYAAVTPQTLFRLASGSKMFACAAIYALKTRGKLDLSQRVFPLLGISKPALASDRPDPHIHEITVHGNWSIMPADGTFCNPFQAEGRTVY